MSLVRRTYHGAAGAAGSLLFLRNARRVALGEWVSVEAAGETPRRGQVIDAGDDVTVVQILDETLGLAPGGAAITLQGQIAAAPVGRELLGRAFNGMGVPMDGLPAPVGERLVPVGGAPMNPARRLRPADLIETGVSAIDGLNTLVRGQKLPIFSGAGLPGLDLEVGHRGHVPAVERIGVCSVTISGPATAFSAPSSSRGTYGTTLP